MYLTTVNKLYLTDVEMRIIDEMCFISKNIYNSTLYEVRQSYILNNEYLSKFDMYKIMKTNDNFKQLPSVPAECAVYAVDDAMKSFYNLLKMKTNGEINFQVNIPRYIDKNGRYYIRYRPRYERSISKKHLDYHNIMVSPAIAKKYNHCGKIKIMKPKHIIGKDIKTITINPSAYGYNVEFVYEEPELNVLRNNDKFLSIDIGVDNLCTVIDNATNKPFIIDGREIKSLNRYFNKEIGKYQSVSKKVNDRDMTKNIERLYVRRSNIFKNKFHAIANYIINHCVENGITNIIVGYNKGWKQGVDLGKVTNQKFVKIPHAKLVSYIEYKAKLKGINFEIHEESYTSKCDALALEKIGKHEKYKGTRVKRGLYKSSTGKLINADLNGAINIARKCKGEIVDLWVSDVINSGVVLTPERIRVS